MQRLLPVLVLLSACSKKAPEPEQTPPPVATTTATVTTAAMSARAAPTAPDDIAWTAPPSFLSVPNPNPMRKATYRFEHVAGDLEDGELTVSAAMGGAEANIQRWSGQFGNAEAKTEPRTVNGLKVIVTELKGTYASGGMMGGPSTPKPKSMLLGAVIDAGQRQYFFKLTGPEKTVTAAKKDFDALVSSARAK